MSSTLQFYTLLVKSAKIVLHPQLASPLVQIEGQYYNVIMLSKPHLSAITSRVAEITSRKK